MRYSAQRVRPPCQIYSEYGKIKVQPIVYGGGDEGDQTGEYGSRRHSVILQSRITRQRRVFIFIKPVFRAGARRLLRQQRSQAARLIIRTGRRCSFGRERRNGAGSISHPERNMNAGSHISRTRDVLNLIVKEDMWA